MLCYDRIDLSEGIDIIETNDFYECNIFHYRSFLIKILYFNQMYVLVVYYFKSQIPL